jgi:predicted lipid-binding transport protein (Tim44 family)
MMQRQAMGATGTAAVAPELSGDDFNVFEQRLSEVQLSYGRNDVDALGRVVTPEMLSYFAKELHENRQKGLRNEIGEPKLLQGDLSETWREANAEYATVAMRYSLYDVTVDGQGRVVEGSRTTPVEATEVWTFVRPVNGRPDQWELSAIQQAA